jgi:hypothetical protein
MAKKKTGHYKSIGKVAKKKKVAITEEAPSYISEYRLPRIKPKSGMKMKFTPITRTLKKKPTDVTKSGRARKTKRR